MANATVDRATTKWAPVVLKHQRVLNIPAATVIVAGVMKCADANQRAVDPAIANAAAQRVTGVTKDRYDNTLGAADALKCELQTGVHEFNKHATNPPLISDVGKGGYANDNQTISILSTDGPFAGVIAEVGTDYVAIDIGAGL